MGRTPLRSYQARPAPQTARGLDPGSTAPLGTGSVQAARPGDTRSEDAYPAVDVAIVMESTYPYLKGGVSAVVHDIVTGNPDVSFGIIHITWDQASPQEDLYGMPANVAWVKPVYLSMHEHRVEFMDLRPSSLGMRPTARRQLAERLYDAIESIVAGDMEPMWQLYDEGMNPLTRTYPLWALLGTKEFMLATMRRLPGLGLSLSQTFWMMREFFSLSYAILGEEMPRAAVYHAHTTGYASLIGAAAARQQGGRFLLTEHNLYVRDTVNTLLDRNLALPVTTPDYHTFDVTPLERAWMAWWIEMGRFCYPSAEAITYLYPSAITEASDLGAPVERSMVVPNGMVVEEFEGVYRRRQQAQLDRRAAGPGQTWRLVYIARVVPIKGLMDLIDSIALLADRGVTNIALDVLGPTEHVPEYFEACRDKIAAMGLQDKIIFRGTVKVRELLGDYDLLVLPSYNEGQPIVVLEAMTAGIPTVGTEVGGMAQLIGDPLTTPSGTTWGAGGLLVQPSDVVQMADGVQRVLGDPDLYAELSRNARGRVVDFFQLGDVLASYHALYRELGGQAVPAGSAARRPADLPSAEPQRVVASAGSTTSRWEWSL